MGLYLFKNGCVKNYDLFDVEDFCWYFEDYEHILITTLQDACKRYHIKIDSDNQAKINKIETDCQQFNNGRTIPRPPPPSYNNNYWCEQKKKEPVVSPKKERGQKNNHVPPPN